MDDASITLNYKTNDSHYNCNSHKSNQIASNNNLNNNNPFTINILKRIIFPMHFDVTISHLFQDLSNDLVSSNSHSFIIALFCAWYKASYSNESVNTSYQLHKYGFPRKNQIVVMLSSNELIQSRLHCCDMMKRIYDTATTQQNNTIRDLSDIFIEKFWSNTNYSTTATTANTNTGTDTNTNTTAKIQLQLHDWLFNHVKYYVDDNCVIDLQRVGIHNIIHIFADLGYYSTDILHGKIECQNGYIFFIEPNHINQVQCLFSKSNSKSLT
jgi:hypothetical protein